MLAQLWELCVRFLEAVSRYLSPHKAIWDHRGNIAVFIRKQYDPQPLHPLKGIVQ